MYFSQPEKDNLEKKKKAVKIMSDYRRGTIIGYSLYLHSVFLRAYELVELLPVVRVHESNLSNSSADVSTVYGRHTLHLALLILLGHA